MDFDSLLNNIDITLLPRLGSGSGRDVYDLRNGYVVKHAKNNKGMAQNQTEYVICSLDSSGIFAPAPALSEDGLYLIMVRAEKIMDFNQVR